MSRTNRNERKLLERVLTHYEVNGYRSKANYDEFINSPYFKIIKVVSHYGFYVKISDFKRISGHIKRVYYRWLVVDKIRVLNIKDLKRRRKVNALFVYEKGTSKINVDRYKKLGVLSTKREYEKLVAQKRNKEKGRRLSTTREVVRNDRKRIKRMSIVIEKLKDWKKCFAKSKLLDDEFVYEISTLINNCEKVRPLVALVNRQFRNTLPVKVDLFNVRGIAPTSVRRKVKKYVKSKSDSLKQKANGVYCQLYQDLANKKGSLVSKCLGFVCPKTEPTPECIDLFDNFDLKYFFLPIHRIQKKDGNTLFIAFNETEGLDVFIYHYGGDDGGENSTFCTYLEQSQNCLVWRTTCSTHDFGKALRRAILLSLRHQRTSSAGSDAPSNLWSVLETEIYKFSKFIDLYRSNLLVFDPSLTFVKYVSSRIFCVVNAVIKALKLIRLIENNQECREFLEARNNERDRIEFLRIVDNPIFSRECLVVGIHGECIQRSFYYFTLSNKGKNVPLIRIKVLQFLVINQVFIESRGYCELARNWFYLIYPNLKNIPFVEIYDLFLRLCREWKTWVLEYFEKYIFDFNYQIALIWEKRYAKQIYQYIMLKRSTNVQYFNPFYGFFEDESIFDCFTRYSNSESTENLLLGGEYNQLAEWYIKMFMFNSGIINTCESSFGSFRQLKNNKPNCSDELMNVFLFKRYNSLLESDHFLTLANEEVFHKLTVEQRSEYFDRLMSENSRLRSRRRRGERRRGRNLPVLTVTPFPAFDEDNVDEALFYFPITEERHVILNSIQNKARDIINHRVSLWHLLTTSKEVNYRNDVE